MTLNAVLRQDGICCYCGEREEIDLLEVWDERRFMLSTCCEALQEDVNWGLANDPDWARSLLQRLGIEDIAGHRLRRVADDHVGGLILDWTPRLGCIAFGDARAFVARHHDHCRPPVAWRFGTGLFNGPDLIGVVIVARPVARAIDQARVVEVTRLCLRRDLPDPLRWNGCSQLYGWAAQQAKARGFERIITYMRQDEDGASLRATGWKCEGPAGGRSWNWRGRPRIDHAPPCPRLRWSRSFVAKPVRPSAQVCSM